MAITPHIDQVLCRRTLGWAGTLALVALDSCTSAMDRPRKTRHRFL